MNTRLVQDIRGPDVQRGDIEHRALPDGTTAGYAYICPTVITPIHAALAARSE